MTGDPSRKINTTEVTNNSRLTRIGNNQTTLLQHKSCTTRGKYTPFSADHRQNSPGLSLIKLNHWLSGSVGNVVNCQTFDSSSTLNFTPSISEPHNTVRLAQYINHLLNIFLFLSEKSTYRCVNELLFKFNRVLT